MVKKVLALFFTLFFCGCAGVGVKTYTIEQPRFDTEIDPEGNRGYLYGEPDREVSEPRFGPTRRISVVEFGFGEKEEVDLEVDPGVDPEYYQEEFTRDDFRTYEVEIKEPVRPPHKYDYKDYTVEENDTLQRISQKFYGTTRRWMLIYEENKDTLDAPDKIYPGMKIRIPILK